MLSKYAETTGVMLAGMQKIIETIYGKVTGSAPEKAPFASPGSPGFQQLSTNPVIPITRSGGTSQKAPTVSPQGAGKAKGGVSTGPVSGYSEILHGTEAVVPLPPAPPPTTTPPPPPAVLEKDAETGGC